LLPVLRQLPVFFRPFVVVLRLLSHFIHHCPVILASSFFLFFASSFFGWRLFVFLFPVLRSFFVCALAARI